MITDQHYIDSRDEFIQMQNEELDVEYGDAEARIINNHAAQNMNVLFPDQQDFVNINQNQDFALEQNQDEREMEMADRLNKTETFLERGHYIDYGGSRNQALATVLHRARTKALDPSQVNMLEELQKRSNELDQSRREYGVEMPESYQVYDPSVDYNIPVVEQGELSQDFNEVTHTPPGREV